MTVGIRPRQHKIAKQFSPSNSVYFRSKMEFRTRRALGDISNNAPRNIGADAAHKPSIAPLAQATAAMSVRDEQRLYMNRPSDNIDQDLDNIFLCNEVVEDMYKIFHEDEKNNMINPQYLESQTFINDKMRKVLIDWMVSVTFLNLPYVALK